MLKLRYLVGLGAAIALALVLGGPAEAQLVYSNPRVNDGQVMIDPLLCQSDYEIRRAIARDGFTHVLLNAPINNHIRVKATKGGVTYLIDYEYCLHPGIVGLTPLRGAR